MLQLLNFEGLVANMAAAVQGACQQLLDLTVGSVLRAVLEANASVALWMQWLIVRVLQTTRAATSTGVDLDSWVADFGVSRLPATSAAGVATFSRGNTSLAALVPVGTMVRTGDGAQSFVVTQASSLPSWNSASNGYVLAVGAASIDLPIAAATAGAGGNVQAGAICLLATAIPGVDTVVNAAPIGGGVDAETDSALRGRFSLFMDSRSRATLLAVQNAILSVRQGLRYSILEALDTNGSFRPGFFTVAVDDGSGAPPQSLINSVTAAIESVRPLATEFAVVPPTLVSAAIAIQTALAPGAPSAVVLANVAAAVQSWIAGLQIGAPLPLARMTQIAFDADPAVVNVLSVTINGTTADLSVPPTGLVHAASVVVN